MPEIQMSCQAVLTTLLGSDSAVGSLERSHEQPPSFIPFFYEHYAAILTKPLCEVPSTPSPSFILGIELVLGLLASNVQSHGTNLQFLLLKYNLFPSILSFLESPSRRLQLVCIQFMASCLLSGVEWYSKYLVKRDYISPLLRYAGEHSTEHTCAMSALLGCLRNVRVKGNKAVWNFIKSKLDAYKGVSQKRPLFDDYPSDKRINC